MRAIMDDLEKKPLVALNPEEKKLRDLYDAFEDTAAIEKNGLGPVQKDLDYLNGLKTLDDVARAMASTKLGTESIYEVSINVDDKNPDAYSINLNQGGLGLPDRDYYLSADKNLVDTRTAYQKYLSDMMKLAGMDDADARAARVVALETEIAKVQWDRADRRDEDKIYNPMQISTLKTLAPEFPWESYFAESRLPTATKGGQRDSRYVIVAEKTAFPPLAQNLRRHAGLNLARLPDRALPAHLCRLFAQEVRRPEFRFLRHGAGGQYPAARPQDPRHPSARRHCWARRWASFMSRAISRRSPRPRPNSWCPIC